MQGWTRKLANHVWALALLWAMLVPGAAMALGEGLQCVPYARQETGIQIYGDAHTWWDQAEGRYARGSRPQVGAIMAFRPYGNMRLGHVAAVSKVLDNRRVLISHANWSTFGGTRGHVEEDVLAMDVSDDNDWSRVRVWYGPNEALGTTQWPLAGFIYAQPPKGGSDHAPAPTYASADGAIARVASATRRPLFDNRLRQDVERAARQEAVSWHPAPEIASASPRKADPIGDLIARSMN